MKSVITLCLQDFTLAMKSYKASLRGKGITSYCAILFNMRVNLSWPSFTVHWLKIANLWDKVEKIGHGWIWYNSFNFETLRNIIFLAKSKQGNILFNKKRTKITKLVKSSNQGKQHDRKTENSFWTKLHKFFHTQSQQNFNLQSMVYHFLHENPTYNLF